MPDNVHGKPEHAYAGNLAVTAGGLLILICFTLPWIRDGDLSAVAVAANEDVAQLALESLDLEGDHPRLFLRPLYMIPVLAVLCMALEWTVPPGAAGRVVARVSLLITGTALSTFFVFFGLRFGARLDYGFWGAMHGALFITVGGVFNAFRRE